MCRIVGEHAASRWSLEREVGSRSSLEAGEQHTPEGAQAIANHLTHLASQYPIGQIRVGDSVPEDDVWRDEFHRVTGFEHLGLRGS